MAEAPQPQPAPAEPLPRGRHKLSRDEVRASQRQRLLQAMQDLVSEVGYEAASVPKVTARARVTGRTFYELFDDKAACFLALCQEQGDALIDALAPYALALEDADDPVTALDAGLDFYLRWWVDQPAGARAYFVELPAAGARAAAQRDRRVDVLAVFLRRAGEVFRARAGDTAPVREIDALAAAILMIELIAREVRADRLEALPALHGDLRHLLLTLLGGGG